MSGHTEGPWKFVPEGLSNEDMGGFYSASGAEICHFGYCTQFYPTEGDPPSEANARLMVSAPELLEALKNITGWMEVMEKLHGELKGGAKQSIEDARAAIAKATQP